jgi:hypothetical protein
LDPGSEIRDPEKIHPGSGSRIQGVKKHRIPDPDPQHCTDNCTSERPEKGRPLRGARWRCCRKIVDVTEHDGGRHAELYKSNISTHLGLLKHINLNLYRIKQFLKEVLLDKST